MSVGSALGLRKWLTLFEAASYIHQQTSVAMTSAEILRLAIDGTLLLSVNIPAPVRARAVSKQEGDSRGHIEGIWDLPAEGAAKDQLELLYADHFGLPNAAIPISGGAIVRQGDTCFELPPKTSYRGLSTPLVVSALPEGCEIVVRLAELEKLAQALLGQAKTTEVDRSLKTTERENLWIIIAALASELSHTKNLSKVAGVLEAKTEALGHRVARTTIEGHLKKALRYAGLFTDRNGPDSR
jgi:hypothetical protein